MKILHKITLATFTAILFSLISCDYDEPISSTVTTYPIIDINLGPDGNETVFVNVGETYNDPGAVATIGGTEIPTTVSFVGQYRGNVSSTLNTNISDIYDQRYTAVNEDGFSRFVARQVIVANTGDLETSIEGLYTSTVFRNGAQGAPASAYTDIEYILIWKNEDGSYQVSDSFGGWYLFGRAIADSETPGGIIVANDIAANDFSFPGTQTNSYFGGSSEIVDLTVDPVTKTLTLTTEWQADATTSYTFVSTLKQVQF